MNRLKVVMLGDSLDHQGGIVTVEKLILKYISPEVEIQQIGTYTNKSAIDKLLIFASSLPILCWRLLASKTDLIHIHISDGGSILREGVILTSICLLFQIPILLHAHGPEFHLTYQSLPVVIQKYLNWIFSKCAGTIVLSKSWQNFYILNLDLQPDRVFVLPNPVELPSQMPNRIDRQQLIMLFFGRIGRRKGCFDLIHAFAKLPTEQQKCSKLILAGDGEIIAGSNLAESLNLADRVEFLGWIDADRRNELLATADIFILPSYNEALPMALLEAMAWGLPVVTTPVGGIPEVVISAKNGLLVAPGDIQQLSLAMQSLIGNRDLRLQLGNAARASVTSLDVTSYCASLSSIYHSVSIRKTKV